MIKISSLTKEDAKEILLRIKKEIYRRSGMNEDGSALLEPELSHYNGPILDGPADDKFEFPEGDEIIRVMQGSPIIDILLEICDMEDFRFVKELDTIPGAYDKEMLNEILTILESTSMHASNSHCRSACTGLCANGCTDTCSGGCQDSCSACSSECSGVCMGMCTGCSAACGTSCGENCGTACSGKATGCTGCSSGCTGCTGCSDTCTSSCTGCSSTCSSCSGGCHGSSGYANSCGCGSSCSSGCGNSAVSDASTSSYYTVSFYHDNMLYGSKAAASGGSTYISMPNVTDIGSEFSNSGDSNSLYWTDSDANVFAPGESVRCVNNTSSYNSYKSQGIVVTRQSTLKTKNHRVPMRYSKYEISSNIFEQSLVTHISSSNNPYEFIIGSDTKITITIKDSSGNIMSGLGNKEWSLHINDLEVAVPYSQVLHKGDKVTMTGIGYEFDAEIRDNGSISKSIQVNETAGIVPYCLCSTFVENADGTTSYGEWEECSLTENEQAKVIVNSSNIDSRMYDDISSITLSAKNIAEIQATGGFAGIRYTVGCEIYSDLSLTDSILIDGKTDKVNNVYLMTDTCVAKIPLVRKPGSASIYEFTIPTLSELGLTEYTELGNDPDKTVTDYLSFEFGKTYTIRARQDICLFLH